MRVRGRGFALILVLIAVVAVFALSMQAAVTARAARVETIVLHDRARHLPSARAAAAIVVQGMSMPATVTTTESGFASGLVGGSGDGQDPQDEEDLEFLKPVLDAMPPAEREKFLRELEESKKKRDPQVDSGADGGGIPGGTGARTSLKTVQHLGLSGRPIDVTVRGTGYLVTVRDAGGLLNINAADEKRIEAYFREVGASTPEAQRIAQQILDWRDSDDFVREQGAEERDYRRRGIAIRNGSIVSLEELLFLPAMTREMFDRARGGLCVSGDGRIHAGSAPIEVLMTIPGMSRAAAERIIRARNEGPLTAQSLESLLPVGTDAGSFIRVEPSNILYLEVVSASDPSIAFEGVAVVGERGVAELGLKAR